MRLHFLMYIPPDPRPRKYQCKICNSALSFGDNYCSNCGKAHSDQDFKSMLKTKVKPDWFYISPCCKVGVLDKDHFCWKCGKEFTDAEKNKMQKVNNSSGVILSIIFMILLFLIVVVATTYKTQQSKLKSYLSNSQPMPHIEPVLLPITISVSERFQNA